MIQEAITSVRNFLDPPPHGLGRCPKEDLRDRVYPLTAKLSAAPIPVKKTWRLNWYGDQGQTSMCVGYAWHALLRAYPVSQKSPIPDVIYHDAQRVDEWPGEDYDGTSVRAGAKVLQSLGKLVRYGWAFSTADVVAWLGQQGPVVLGTNWYDGMFTPTTAGEVLISGRLAGGHAYLAIGYDAKKSRVLCHNSWGRSWGLQGRFYLSYATLDRLIREQGEACAPTEK